MEKTHTGKGHDDAILIALFDDQIVTDGAAGFGDILDTGSGGALDVVGEGEEGIGTQGNSVPGIQPSTLFLRGQRLRTSGEVVLPDAVGADILFVAVDVTVNDVVPIGAAQIVTEGQGQRLGMLPQEPGVGLGACQSGAVNAALLTGAHTDGLSIVDKADGVRLGIFEGNEGNDQIDLRTIGQLFLLGDDVLQQMLANFDCPLRRFFSGGTDACR